MMPSPEQPAEVEVAPASEAATALPTPVESQSVHQSSTEQADKPHPIRERLLAKARYAASQKELPSPAPPEAAALPPARGLDELQPMPPAPSSAVDLELEQLSTGPTAPGTPRAHRFGGQLSPNMVAVFGTLLGLASVASIVALAMSIEQRSLTDFPQPPASASAKAVAKGPPKQAAVKPLRKREKLKGPWRIGDEKGSPRYRSIAGKVGTKPFLRAIQDAGLKKKQAYRAYAALKHLRNLDKCDRSDQFKALVKRDSGSLYAFEYIVSSEEVYQAKENGQGHLVSKKLDLKVARHQIKGALTYDGKSFDASSRAGGFDPGLDKVLEKALDGHLSLAELERGDRLRVVAQEVTVLGGFARYAGVEAVEVVFADADQKPLRIYYFHHPVEGGYYDANARAPYEGGWRKPIKDAPITSKFNPKRMHPLLKKVMPHNGTDFGAAVGTPVGASSFGVVSFIGYAGPSGNLVKIAHPGGIETGYAHLSRFAEGLKVGDRVKRLGLVGYVGSTGRSTGPHLHFSAKKDGKFIDPETLNLDGMRVMSAEVRPEFAKTRAKYDKLLEAVPLPKELPPPDVARSTVQQTPLFETPNGPGEEPSEASEAEAPEPPEEVTQRPTAPAKSASTQNPLYLTDDELLKMQGLSADGEVEQ